MLISYAKYIELMSALDEHCRSTLKKYELQNVIFDRYTGKYGSFVVENANGVKRRFSILFQKTKKNNTERKIYRSFMNIELKSK